MATIFRESLVLSLSLTLTKVPPEQSSCNSHWLRAPWQSSYSTTEGNAALRSTLSWRPRTLPATAAAPQVAGTCSSRTRDSREVAPWIGLPREGDPIRRTGPGGTVGRSAGSPLRQSQTVNHMRQLHLRTRNCTARGRERDSWMRRCCLPRRMLPKAESFRN